MAHTPRLTRLFATIALAIVVAACGSTATPAPTGAGGGGGGGGGATPVPGTSSAAGGGVDAATLEAALPGTLCGQPSKKNGITGSATVDASAPPNPFAAFGAAGGAFAYAEGAGDCQTSAMGFAATGLAASFMMQAIALAATGSGSSGQLTLGGKTVYKIIDTPTSTYFYAKDNAFYAVQAATDNDAADALQQMP